MNGALGPGGVWHVCPMDTMEDRRLLYWPSTNYHKKLLQYCVLFLLLFVVLGQIFVTISYFLAVILHLNCACALECMEWSLPQRQRTGRTENTQHCKFKSIYTESILYDILVEANTAVSYHPCGNITSLWVSLFGCQNLSKGVFCYSVLSLSSVLTVCGVLFPDFFWSWVSFEEKILEPGSLLPCYLLTA